MQRQNLAFSSMPSLTGRAVMQKAPRVENRSLLSLAHSLPCFAAFPHDCNAHLGCHPAHANWLRWNKGVGKKVSDWAYAAMCGNAHDMIDGRRKGLDTAAREYYWLNAFITTHDYLWKMKLLKVA